MRPQIQHGFKWMAAPKRHALPSVWSSGVGPAPRVSNSRIEVRRAVLSLPVLLHRGRFIIGCSASKFSRSKGTILRHCLGCTIIRSQFSPNFRVLLSYFSADLLRPGRSNPSDEHDKGSSADLVHQDSPDDVVKMPSHEVPVVGRAFKIRFGPVGAGFDLTRLA